MARNFPRDRFTVATVARRCNGVESHPKDLHSMASVVTDKSHFTAFPNQS